MNTPRISASSYSNTAPLIWSFLYGRNHGRVELILDNAPARSAELLAQSRVDAALVPVIAYHAIENVRLIADVCVGARERVQSVCLVTKGMELTDVRSVSLDVSSRTSVVLTKLIFREFLGFEPEWKDAKPDVHSMLEVSDAALLIGDPALRISGGIDRPDLTTFDLAELWHKYTGSGFVFAMWMTRNKAIDIDLAAARDEGIEHIDEVARNYAGDIGLSTQAMTDYLKNSISYSIEPSMYHGLTLYYELAAKHKLIDGLRELIFV